MKGNEQGVVTLLDTIAIVQPRITLWSGRCKLAEGDVQFAQGGQPDRQAVTMGQKFLVRPGSLKGLSAAKAGILEILESEGVPALGGYAVEKARLPEVMARVSERLAAFERAKAEFLGAYDKERTDWDRKHPRLHTREVSPEGSALERKISAECTVYRVGAESPESGGAFAEAVGRDMRQAGLESLRGLAAGTVQACGLVAGGHLPRGASVCRQLERIHARAKALSYLMPGLTRIAREARRIRGGRDTSWSGAVTGERFEAVRQLFLTVANRALLEAVSRSAAVPLDDGPAAARAAFQGQLDFGTAAAVRGPVPETAEQAAEEAPLAW